MKLSAVVVFYNPSEDNITTCSNKITTDNYTNKPICSAMGIHNPVKLDISKLNL